LFGLDSQQQIEVGELGMERAAAVDQRVGVVIAAAAPSSA
jgi:hypothetical protein